MNFPLYQLVKTISAAILIVSVCCALQKPSPAKPGKPYRQNRDMYFVGKVKSVEDFNFKHDPGDSGIFSRCFKEYYKFDTAGNLVESISFGKNNKFSVRSVFRYDEAGNYIEWKCFAEDSSRLSKHNYEFDKDGNMIKHVQYRRTDSVIDIQQLYYDEHGNMVELCSEPEDFHINSTYVYDSLSRPLTKERMDVHKVINRHTKNLQFITYKYRYTYKYSGDTREETLYNGNYKGYTTTVWNKYNKVLDRHGINDFTLRSFNETYKYDASGLNIIEYKEVKEGVLNAGSSYRCKYVYDKKGNWIKRTTTSLDKKTICSVERKIEYY
jgi:hypothetical protein